MKIYQLVSDISTQLQDRFDDTTLCTQNAWWILQAITGKSQEALIASDNVVLSQFQQKKLDDWLSKIITKRMPTQYMIGYVPFSDISILVKPPTLIPRPETEEWCMRLIAMLKKLTNKSINILDIATGSGCIAVALAKALPESHVYATDISPKAIELASKNAQHNSVNNITLIKSDLFNDISSDVAFDLIVSNPPYVSEREWKLLDSSVTEWEDKNALVAESDGFAIITAIINQSKHFLRYNQEIRDNSIAQLWIEIGYTQGAHTVGLLKAAGYTDISLNKDLEGKDRYVCANFSHSLK